MRSEPSIDIRTFGPFQVHVGGKPLAVPRHAPRRQMQLLKVLVALGGQSVPIEQFTEALWPDAEGDKSLQALHSTLYRLRERFAADLVTIADGRLSLDTGLCRVDALAFAEAVEEARRALEEPGFARAQACSERVLAIYSAPFLEGEFEPAPIPAARARLHGLFLRHVERMGNVLTGCGETRQALDLYRSALAIDPGAEEIAQALMRCCADEGLSGEGLAAFETLRQTLLAQYEVEPGKATQSLRRELLETARIHRDTGSIPPATRRVAGLRGGLIGRDVEMALLERAVQRLRGGRGSILSLSGEAGSGKSRVVEEFRGTLPAQGIRWWAGNAYDYSRGIPYYPVIDLLSHAWEIKEEDPPGQVKQKFESRIRGLLDDPESAIPFVGGLYVQDYPKLIGVSPEYWAQRLHAALLAIFEAMAAEAPTVFIIEDLHWADPSTLDLLRHVLTRFRRPAITLCTYRPPFRLFAGPGTEKVPGYREIELEPLPPSQTEELVVTLLGDATPPPELVRLVQEKAEGNPFYVEEVLTLLIESGALKRENGSWRLAGSLSAFHVPATVREVIAARVDRLERANRRLLQEASVIGHSFPHKVLGRTAEHTENLDERLNGLEQTDLIRTHVLQPDLAYMFKHAVTQEVVYDSLLESERGAIHERVAQVMEELLKDRLPEFYETLAFHYKQGRSLQKAVDYLIKSGEKAVNRFSLDEAHQYYQEAYDLLSGEPDKTEHQIDRMFDLLDKWAIVFYYFGTFGALSELLQGHEPLAETLRDKGRRGMFAAWMGCALYFRQRPHESYRYLKLALSLAEEAADRRVIGYACTWLAMTCGILTRYGEGIAHGERAQEIAQNMPEDHYLYFKSLAMIGFNLTSIGEAAKTAAVGRRLLEYGEETSNPRSLLWAHQTIARGHAAAGDIQAALKSSEMAVNVSKDPFYLASVEAEHEMYGVIAGKDPSMLERVCERFRSLGVEGFANRMGGIVGFGKFNQGRMAEGIKLIEECSRRSLENGDQQTHAFNENMKGRVYLQMAIGARPRRGVVLKNLGFLLAHRPFAGRRAQTLLGKAARFYAEVGAYGNQAQALLNLGLLHKAKKRKEKARECLAEAERLFERASAGGFLQRTRDAMAQLK